MSQLQIYQPLLDNRVKSIFTNTEGSMEQEFLKYSAYIKHDQLQYTMFSVVGLTMGQVILDGQTPASDRPIQGYQKTVTQQIFTHRLRIGQMTSFFLGIADPIGGRKQVLAKIDSFLAPKLSELKGSINHVKNALAQSMLQNGFATSFTFTPISDTLVDQRSITIDTSALDGVAAFSAAHTNAANSTTYSNIVTVNSTVNAPFSLAALLAARSAYAKITDDRGLPTMGNGIDTLIVRKKSANAFLATTIKRTLESGMYPSTSTANVSTAGVTGSFVDRANTETFNIIELIPYTNVSTALNEQTYFLADSAYLKKDNYGLNYIETKETVVTPQYTDYLGNLDIVVTATSYATFTFGDTRRIFGSNGTGA
jgi:hypothetical protein